MDIYEVELCRRGRWEQQDARFVAPVNADEAAYKVTGDQLSKERQDREQPASPTSAANLPHIYNDAFARRAGEIIARAAAAAYRRDNRR